MAVFLTLPNLWSPITRPSDINKLWNHCHSLAKHVVLPILSADLGNSDTETHLVFIAKTCEVHKK